MYQIETKLQGPKTMGRHNVLNGCQLMVPAICGGANYEGSFEKHHLIPRTWAEEHSESMCKIKGGRDLTLMLDPNCHRWVHDEMRRRKLIADSTEQDMFQFVDYICAIKRY